MKRNEIIKHLQEYLLGSMLCADRSDAVVLYTLSEDNKQIFTSRYMTYIPSEEESNVELRFEKYC